MVLFMVVATELRAAVWRRQLERGAVLVWQRRMPLFYPNSASSPGGRLALYALLEASRREAPAGARRAVESEAQGDGCSTLGEGGRALRRRVGRPLPGLCCEGRHQGRASRR